MKCVICEKEFDSNKSSRKYCGDLCRSYAAKIKVEKHKNLSFEEFKNSRLKNCDKCNLPFDKSDLSRKYLHEINIKGEFCPNCSKNINDTYRNYIIRKNELKESKKKTCPICGIKFIGNYNHCSLECWKIYKDNTTYLRLDKTDIEGFVFAFNELGLDNIDCIEISYDGVNKNIKTKDGKSYSLNIQD